MNDIKVVAFDCDGVMFDTIKANLAFYNHILEHFGRSAMTKEQLDYVHMHTADNAIAFLFDNQESYEAAQEYRKTLSYLPFLRYMEIEPYLKPLLEKLRPEYKTAVATNRTDTMNGVLKQHCLEGYFDLVVSALDVDRPKPYPDSLIKIMKHFKIDQNQIIYVGDSELDERAAKAAGVIFVAYDNKSLTAEYHIDSLKEIEEIIDFQIHSVLHSPDTAR